MISHTLPSPRLPPELLEMIVGDIKDRESMRRCCVASAYLLPYARRALFSEVWLYLDVLGHLDRMLQCYTTRPYAQFARSLVIGYRYEHGGAELLTDYPQLLSIVALLSTCPQRTPPPGPPSLITSLRISRVFGSRLNFARIIRAFPSLTKLECDPVELWRAKQHDLDLFLASAPPPPCLEVLHTGTSHFRGFESVLFPAGSGVQLRSLTVSHYVEVDNWNPILRRAGPNLEVFEVSAPRDGRPEGELSHRVMPNNLADHTLHGKSERLSSTSARTFG